MCSCSSLFQLGKILLGRGDNMSEQHWHTIVLLCLLVCLYISAFLFQQFSVFIFIFTFHFGLQIVIHTFIKPVVSCLLLSIYFQDFWSIYSLGEIRCMFSVFINLLTVLNALKQWTSGEKMVSKHTVKMAISASQL